MNDPITNYAETLADAQVRATVDALAAALPADLPAGVTLSTDGNDIMLSGTDLVARYATDVRLNGIAMMAKAVLA